MAGEGPRRAFRCTFVYGDDGNCAYFTGQFKVLTKGCTVLRAMAALRATLLVPHLIKALAVDLGDALFVTL